MCLTGLLQSIFQCYIWHFVITKILLSVGNRFNSLNGVHPFKNCLTGILEHLRTFRVSSEYQDRR